jgi:hypothetical protein
MKSPHDKVLSHWATKGNYGKAMANDHGMGSRHMGGSKGAYIPTSLKTGKAPAKPTFVEKNSPGKGSGHMSNRPVGGRSGRVQPPRLGRIDMGNSD